MEKLARALVFVTALSAPGLFGAGASAFEPDPILQNPVAPVGSFGEESGRHAFIAHKKTTGRSFFYALYGFQSLMDGRHTLS